ncbi:hypothetical protein [Arsenicibacter rosenii]|uniref:Uncharacterized protein n=1 Tax=Arsenicibacter rosenii TaxID=1750698 RepID=A0A1S2VHD1_9BACT|nr:hypothetical protein [Arsenicibacter rosenii]OIN58142.1 hypothetical protein BLX24_16625 [Arsenicibacter rosenii]
MAGQVPYILAGLRAGMESMPAFLGINGTTIREHPPEAMQGVGHLENSPLNPNIPKRTEGERGQQNNRWFCRILVFGAIVVAGLAIQKCRQPRDSTNGVYTDTTSRAEPAAVDDTSTASKRRVEQTNGQVYDSTGSGPPGTRDSSNQ